MTVLDAGPIDLSALGLRPLAASAPESTDRSGAPASGEPRGLATPRSAEEVAQIVRHAADHGIPVVTRGAGSGLAGGAAAVSGAIVLDLSGLNRILRIDPIDEVAVVEPGVITAQLDRAAAEYGLRYAPDPASHELSTIGGNIATNAGGLRAAKYGVTRQSVLSLDVVLADGSIVSTGRPTIKGVTGFDLTSLIVGSEGTLGVVVGATLRLQPAPVGEQTVAAYFTSVADAVRAAQAISAARVQPAVLELVDGAALAAIDVAEGTALRARGAAFLLIQTDGHGAAAEAEAVVGAVRPFATQVDRAADTAEAAVLTRARRGALPAIERLGRVIIEDIAVPRSRLLEAVAAVERIGAETGAPIFTIGHVGDGNLHPLVLVPAGADGSAAEAAAEAAAANAAERIYALALDLGGTVSGEHGVGTAKLPWARAELGERSLRLHAGIKRAFDPTGILNPGKGF